MGIKMWQYQPRRSSTSGSTPLEAHRNLFRVGEERPKLAVCNDPKNLVDCSSAIALERLFEAGPELRIAVNALLASAQPSNAIDLALQIYLAIQVNGTLGIGGDCEKPRRNGCRTANEVYEERDADCNETTTLFLSMWNYSLSQLGKKTAAILRPTNVTLQGERVFNHACIAMFVRQDEAINVALAKYGHKKFNTDKDFRSRVLESAHVKDSEDVHLLLIDPCAQSMVGFGTNYNEIIVDSGEESLLFQYYLDAAENLLAQGRTENAVKAFKRRAEMRIAQGSQDVLLDLEFLRPSWEIWQTAVDLLVQHYGPEITARLIKRYIHDFRNDTYAERALSYFLQKYAGQVCTNNFSQLPSNAFLPEKSLNIRTIKL